MHNINMNDMNDWLKLPRTYLAESVPNTVWLDFKKTKERVELNDTIHHWCARQTPTIGSFQGMTSLGRLRFPVFDALRLIENDSVKCCFSRVEKRKFDGRRAVVKIKVSAGIFLVKSLQPFQFFSNSPVGSQHDIVSKEIIDGCFLVVIYENGQPVSCCCLVLDLIFPLPNEGQWADNQVGLH